jgi:hypothetical protein
VTSMNDETNIPAIEQRLQVEARNLLAADNAHARSAAQLWTVYRQQKRRRALRAAMTASAALSLVAAGLVLGWRHHEASLPAVARNATVATRGKEPPSTKLSIVATDFASDESLVVIPFVIGDSAAGEEVISGVYIPEQSEPIDQLDLSPAERDAVRAVLGIEGQDSMVFQPI